LEKCFKNCQVRSKTNNFKTFGSNKKPKCVNDSQQSFLWEKGGGVVAINYITSDIIILTNLILLYKLAVEVINLNTAMSLPPASVFPKLSSKFSNIFVVVSVSPSFSSV
jgi:hypothetical protein